MRISEILLEDVETEVNQSLKQMFIPYLAQKKSKVDMSTVLDTMTKLHGQEWDVSKDWVMDTLDGAAFVKSITPDEIYLNVDTPDALGAQDAVDKAEDHVAKMAKKAIKK
jgi:phage gp29-like protein